MHLHCPYLARNAQSHFLALLLQKVSKIHINLFSVATSVVIISPCYKFSRQYTTAASFIFGLARPIWTQRGNICRFPACKHMLHIHTYLYST